MTISGLLSVNKLSKKIHYIGNQHSQEFIVYDTNSRYAGVCIKQIMCSCITMT